MARKFLYVIAAGTVLVIATLAALRIWSAELTRWAFVPTTEFSAPPPLARNAYDGGSMWFARPGTPGEALARWQPLYSRDSAPPPPLVVPQYPRPDFALFFVHPTSYLARDGWNAPVDDRESQDRARLFVRAMASPFNAAGEIWAPKYRQATLGAFLVEQAEADQALDIAYGEVKLAFEAFLRGADPARPIVLAGHSQGSYHLLRLLAEHADDTALKARIAAVYAVGWPVSLAHDIPSLGLGRCTAPDQSGCIMSWASYAEPADPSERLKHYAASIALDGKKRGQSPVLCTNPLTGGAGAAAPASANMGSLKPDMALKSGELVAGGVPARCDEAGLLLIGDPPDMGAFVLPGNDYHVYDIPLFWRNLQLDANRRVAAWRKAQ